MQPSNITDQIYKSLRLLPEFDGNPNVITRFLKLCDQLVLTYIKPEPGNELSNLSLINGILNKITGPAARTLATNGIPNDWKSIRATLINSFSDQRDETSLYTDLSLLVQGSDTPQIYYEKVQNLLCTIMCHVELHENVETTIESKRTLYKNLALETFLRGLAEPLGSRIRCMRPPTLEKALEYAHKESNIIYLQNKNRTIPPRKNFQSPYQLASHSFRPHHNFNSQLHTTPNTLSLLPQNPRQQGPSFRPPYAPPQSSPVMQYRQPYFRPSRTQQMFREPPTNVSTGFRIPSYHRPNQHHQKNNNPTPMSGISHRAARTLPPTYMQAKRNLQNNLPPTQELNMNESYNDFYYQDNSNANNDPDSDNHYYVVTEPDLDNQNLESVTENSNFCLEMDQTAPE